MNRPCNTAGSLRWTGHVAWILESRNIYALFGGEPGKGQLGSSNTRRGDNMKMGLREVGYKES